MATQRTTQNVNVTFDRDLLSRARALGINLSQTFTTAIDAGCVNMRRHAGKKRMQKVSQTSMPFWKNMAAFLINTGHSDHAIFRFNGIGKKIGIR